MKLAASNIAWTPQERQMAYEALRAAKFTGLEVAPALFLHEADDPFAPSVEAIAKAKKEVSSFGLTLISMQSLLFGVNGAALFGDVDALSRFETAMMRAIALAGNLEIPNLVFGSPKQRVIPPEMPHDAAQERAAEVFNRLGNFAHAEGCKITIESNPAAYGTNFLNTFEQACAFVRHTDHPAIKVILDLGAIYMNDGLDCLAEQVTAAEDILYHVHISAPNLMPAPVNESDAHDIMGILRAIDYKGFTSIEMQRPVTGIETLTECLARLSRAAHSTEVPNE